VHSTAQMICYTVVHAHFRLSARAGMSANDVEMGSTAQHAKQVSSKVCVQNEPRVHVSQGCVCLRYEGLGPLMIVVCRRAHALLA
jgi:hypothetical protein